MDKRTLNDIVQSTHGKLELDGDLTSTNEYPQLGKSEKICIN